MKTIIAAILILLGSVPCLLFKQLNESPYGVFRIVTCFSEKNQNNTAAEFRFMNHGKIQSIERHLHEKIYPYAITSLILQCLIWSFSFAVFCINYRKHKSFLGDSNNVQKFIFFVLIGLSIIIWVKNFP